MVLMDVVPVVNLSGRADLVTGKSGETFTKKVSGPNHYLTLL